MKTVSILVQVPDWVTHVAQETHGIWWGHENKPEIYPSMGEWAGKGRVIRIATCEYNPNWRETLREVE